MKFFHSKAWRITASVFTWLVTACAVFMMLFTLISVRFLDHTQRSLFGLQFYAVQSDSMAATDFRAGDIIISRRIKPEKLEEGDIITFVSQSPKFFGQTVTHKIRRVTTDTDGSLAFVTYGTTTNEDDGALARLILGKYVCRLPQFGTFFAFLKTTLGYVLCILLPFLILLILQAVHFIRLLLAYRGTQVADGPDQSAQLEQALDELERLRAQLALAEKQSDGQTSDTPTDTSQERS